MNSFRLDFVVVLWFPRRRTIPKRMATDFRRNLATSNVVIVSLALNGGRRIFVNLAKDVVTQRTRLLPVTLNAIVDSDGEWWFIAANVDYRVMRFIEGLNFFSLVKIKIENRPHSIFHISTMILTARTLTSQPVLIPFSCHTTSDLNLWYHPTTCQLLVNTHGARPAATSK